VTRVGPDPSGGVREFLAHAKAGGGLVCFGMAHLYAAAASGNGLQARIIGLSRNLGDRYDAHTTVEVRQTDGGSFRPYLQRELCERRYPARRRGDSEGVPGRNVPVDHASLLPTGSIPRAARCGFAHVTSTVQQCIRVGCSTGEVGQTPAIPVLARSRIYVKTLPGHPNEHVRFVNTLYWIASAFLPLLGVAILALGGLCWWASRRVAASDAPDDKDQRADVTAE